MLTIDWFSLGTVNKFNVEYINIKINIDLILVDNYPDERRYKF